MTSRNLVKHLSIIRIKAILQIVEYILTFLKKIQLKIVNDLYYSTFQLIDEPRLYFVTSSLK